MLVLYLASSVGRALGFYVQVETKWSRVQVPGGVFFFPYFYRLLSTVLNSLSTLCNYQSLHIGEEIGT